MDCHEYTLDIDDICLHSEQCEAKPSTQIQYELTLDGIVVGKGTLGFRGNGIKNVSYIPSTEDEGENVVTVLTDDGQTFTFNVRNGSRGNGISSIDVEQSDVDAGASKLTVNFTDGDSKEFLVYNGTSVSKVEQTVKSTADSGTNVLKITLDDGTSSEFEVRNGSKGSTPTKSDLGLENVDNTSDMDKPVSTEMEQALETKVSKVDYPFSIDADGRLNITYTEE